MDYLIDSYYLQWPFAMLLLEGVCMWLGFVACTYYVWKIKVSVQNTPALTSCSSFSKTR